MISLGTKKCFILNVYYKWDQGRSTHTFKNIIKKYIGIATMVAVIWSQHSITKLSILCYDYDPNRKPFSTATMVANLI